jgi:hypothetical protein
MAKIQTVNVMEMANDDLLGVTSFIDDQEGNQEAEALFRERAIENGCEEKDVDSFIEDGYWEEGTYQIFLSHSE